MNIKSAVLLALGASGSAYACDCTLPQNYGNKACAAAITAALNAKPASSLSQQQGQGQVQQAYGGSTGAITNSASGGQGGQGGQGGAGGKGGSATSTSTASSAATSSDIGNTYGARSPVNTAVAGFQETTSMCWHAEGLGVQGVGAAGSVGFTFKDQDCIRFTIAQGMYARGQNDAANKLICDIKAVAKSLGRDCLSVVAIVYAPPAPPAVCPPGMHCYDDATLKRMITKMAGK